MKVLEWNCLFIISCSVTVTVTNPQIVMFIRKGTFQKTFAHSFKSMSVLLFNMKSEKMEFTGPKDARFLKRIACRGEKWIFYRNPDTHQQWLTPGQIPDPAARHDRCAP